MAGVLITERGRQVIRRLPRRANEGNEATLNGKLYRYISNKWVEISAAQDVPAPRNITDSYVKRKYENNEDTNVLTDDLLEKLTELPTASELAQQIADATANFLTRSEILALIGTAQSAPCLLYTSPSPRDS